MNIQLGEGGERANSRTIPSYLLFQGLIASSFSLECCQSSLLDVHLDSAQYSQPQLNGTAVYDSIEAAEMQFVKPEHNST